MKQYTRYLYVKEGLFLKTIGLFDNKNIATVTSTLSPSKIYYSFPLSCSSSVI